MRVQASGAQIGPSVNFLRKQHFYFSENVRRGTSADIAANCPIGPSNRLDRAPTCGSE
jgi:hypothetical protein